MNTQVRHNCITNYNMIFYVNFKYIYLSLIIYKFKNQSSVQSSKFKIQNSKFKKKTIEYLFKNQRLKNRTKSKIKN